MLCFRKCKIMDRGQIILFQSQGGDTFKRNKSTISRLIRNIFNSGELQKNSVVAENATTAADGEKAACPEWVHPLFDWIS